MREAAKRTLGQRHYDVQLIGGVILHRGSIAEMKTGEGKTLVATLPAYLNALGGRGVHIVTVNDYLARRDSAWMGEIHRFLGLSVGVIVHDLTDQQRRDAYGSDITYVTNNELGFDYLRDNMKFSLESCVQRELHYAIVDEVDSILIDEARTPLIISGPSEQNTQLYAVVNRMVPKLKAGTKGEPNQNIEETGDYWIDEKTHSVGLTEEGVHNAEKLLGVENLYDPEMLPALHAVNQALSAHSLKKLDVDYVVRAGEGGQKEVVIVDEFTGRLMPGRRWSDGLHQAVEAKEGITVRSENQTLASVTFQNFFRMYEKLAGMTGTADTEAPGVREDLRPRREPDPDQPSDDPRGPRGRGLQDQGREVHGGGRGDHRAPRQGAADPGRHHLDRNLRDALAQARQAGHPAQRAQRQAARARGRDRGPGRPQGRRHHLDQHGRPRHRHRAGRQPGVPGAREVRRQQGASRLPGDAGGFRRAMPARSAARW